MSSVLRLCRLWSLWLLAPAACIEQNPNDNETNSLTSQGPGSFTETLGSDVSESAETSAAQLSDVSDCEHYLRCLSKTSPGDFPAAFDKFGPAGECWQNADALDSQACLDACVGLRRRISRFYPDEMACVDCYVNEDCPADKPQCSAQLQRCVQCESDEHCTLAERGPVCRSFDNVCVQCEHTSDCADKSGTPFCRERGNICVACINDSQCDGQICDSESGACRPCQDTDGCMFGCAKLSGKCAQCSDDAQCGPGTSCIDSVCKCVPGDVFCRSEFQVARCDTSGESSTLIESCKEGKYCDENAIACVDQPFCDANGTPTCVKFSEFDELRFAGVQSCKEDGSGYNITDCGLKSCLGASCEGAFYGPCGSDSECQEPGEVCIASGGDVMDRVCAKQADVVEDCPMGPLGKNWPMLLDNYCFLRCFDDSEGGFLAQTGSALHRTPFGCPDGMVCARLQRGSDYNEACVWSPRGAPLPEDGVTSYATYVSCIEACAAELACSAVDDENCERFCEDEIEALGWQNDPCHDAVQKQYACRKNMTCDERYDDLPDCVALTRAVELACLAVP